jgi:hypothetical protein
MAAVPLFLPLDPFFQSLVVCRAAGSLVYVHEAFESAFQICLVLKKCYSNLSSVSRNIVSHCLKLVQCALIEMLLDTLHLRGLCFTQSNSKIGKLCKRSYGAHWYSSSCFVRFSDEYTLEWWRMSSVGSQREFFKSIVYAVFFTLWNLCYFFSRCRMTVELWNSHL